MEKLKKLEKTLNGLQNKLDPFQKKTKELSETWEKSQKKGSRRKREEEIQQGPERSKPQRHELEIIENNDGPSLKIP